MLFLEDDVGKIWLSLQASLGLETYLHGYLWAMKIKVEWRRKLINNPLIIEENGTK